MVEVLSALGDLYLVERYLVDKTKPVKNWQHGEYSDGTVTINPAPHIVDTLVHEVLHHIRPDWSETVVRARTTQLLRKMSHEEAQAIYQQWLARKTEAS
jgi:hypothetical protein